MGSAHLVDNLLSANKLVAAIITSNTSYGKELSNLAKIYITNTKYSGCNNSFIFKLAIFRDIYLRANVLTKSKMKLFPTLFKSLVLDYYYSIISISTVTINFDQVCNSIRNYFKEAEYKQCGFSK